MRRWQQLMVLTAGLFLGACASSPVPVDHYYRIQSSAKPAPQRLPVLSVDAYEARGIYAERPLLFSASPDGAIVEQYRYDFWAEPVQQMLGDALMNQLRSAAGEQNVHERSARVDAERLILPRLRQLEHVRSAGRSQAHLSAEFEVSDGRRQPLFRVAFDDTEDCADEPAAYAAAVGRLADRAHAKLLERLAAAP
jgi:uncharacterized lipoprotein YmbA